MIGRSLLAMLVAAGAAAGPGAGVAVESAAGRGAPEPCDPEKGTATIAAPWAQHRLNFRSVWPLTMGEGVTVAIIDSGVDSKHRQIPLFKEVDMSGTGHRDCMGHGTAVAGIIAARPADGVPFYGVAPRVKLISFKQTNSARTGRLDILVNAIRSAADAEVDVLNISVETSDEPSLKAAIAYALSRDVVVVAAAGNVTEDGKSGPSYPAAYEGVLAVGSAAPDGRRSDSSNAATPVGVLAPGTAVTSTWTGGFYATGLVGTSYAAPYVAGVAALVRARHPGLDQIKVRRRILTTADGASGEGTGAGMVNPFLAVTAILPSENVAVAPPRPPALPPGVVSKAPPVDHRAIGTALVLAASALVLSGAVVAGRLLLPMGHRRGWRPGHKN